MKLFTAGVARKLLVGVFALGASLTVASTATKPQAATPGSAEGKNVIESSDKYVSQTEERIKQIDQEVGQLEKSQLQAQQQEALAELKKKQEVAKSQIVEVKAAPSQEKTEKVRELSETMSDVEQLLVKLDSHKLNPSE